MLMINGDVSCPVKSEYPDQVQGIAAGSVFRNKEGALGFNAGRSGTRGSRLTPAGRAFVDSRSL